MGLHPREPARRGKRLTLRKGTEAIGGVARCELRRAEIFSILRSPQEASYFFRSRTVRRMSPASFPFLIHSGPLDAAGSPPLASVDFLLGMLTRKL